MPAMSAEPLTHLLYLHGFRSSPRSTKARQVEARMRERHPDVHWWCPQLPCQRYGCQVETTAGVFEAAEPASA